MCTHGGFAELLQHRPASLNVRTGVLKHERALAYDRLHHAGALAGMEHIGGGGEHRLYVLGIGENDERWIWSRVECEGSAIACTTALEQREDVPGHHVGLCTMRKSWTRRELARAYTPGSIACSVHDLTASVRARPQLSCRVLSVADQPKPEHRQQHLR